MWKQPLTTSHEELYFSSSRLTSQSNFIDLFTHPLFDSQKRTDNLIADKSIGFFPFVTGKKNR